MVTQMQTSTMQSWHMVAYARHSSCVTNYHRVVLGYFSGDAITDAKDCLWSAAGNQEIERVQKRRAALSHTQAEIDIDDVIEALDKLDDANSFPNITISCNELSLIPKLHPGETNNVYVVERLSELE